jgi:hypothetical protein
MCAVAVGMFVPGAVLHDSWNLQPDEYSNLSAPAAADSRNQHPYWWEPAK